MGHDLEECDGENLSDAREDHWVHCLQRLGSARDRDAFRELFEHFAPAIKSFGHRAAALQQPDQFAEELLQETMLNIWMKASSFDPDLASPSTWIFTIARNMRVDLLRKQTRHTVNTVSMDCEDEHGELLPEDIWLDDKSSNLFNLLAQQRSRRQIHESLKTLSPEQADVLEKVYLEDKSHSEVAAELALPLGTVKSRVRLALGKLKLIVDR